MPQQKLNLLQLAAFRGRARRRAPQIMRRQLADPDLRCVCRAALYDRNGLGLLSRMSGQLVQMSLY